jgi:hypothetical protein
VTSLWNTAIVASHDAVFSCIDAYSSTKPEDWFVTLGEHKLGEKESFEQIRNISKIILHPQYVSMVMEGIYDTPPDYDIGKINENNCNSFLRFLELFHIIQIKI